MEYKFKNSYGIETLFLREGNSFEMKGGDWFLYEFNVDTEGNFLNYKSVDTSGGPYISVGMDMGYIHDDLKGLVIESIERTKEGEDKILLKTKLL